MNNKPPCPHPTLVNYQQSLPVLPHVFLFLSQLVSFKRQLPISSQLPNINQAKRGVASGGVNDEWLLQAERKKYFSYSIMQARR
jgi:hypothetical protein